MNDHLILKLFIMWVNPYQLHPGFVDMQICMQLIFLLTTPAQKASDKI